MLKRSKCNAMQQKLIKIDALSITTSNYLKRVILGVVPAKTPTIKLVTIKIKQYNINKVKNIPCIIKK
jgi:hypothetical protein